MQMGIIVFFSAFTGWIVSWLTTRLAFSTYSQSRMADKAGQAFQQEFASSNFIDQQLTDPRFFDKMKPEIERHVDLFLNEKLATVFPLLYKFMGEKTLMQFKDAFMIEIDLLFPLIIRNYMSTLKKEIRLDTIIASRINAIPPKTIRLQFFKYARKEIFYFRLICSLSGFMMGIFTVIVLYLAR